MLQGHGERPVDITPFVYQSYDFFHRLFRIRGRVPQQLDDPAALIPAGGQQHRKGEGPLPDVGAGRLPQQVGGGHQVQSVVGDLEDPSQFEGPQSQDLHHVGRGVARSCPHVGRRANQAGSLLVDQLPVKGEIVVEPTDQSELQRLALHQLGVGDGQHAHRLDVQIGGGHLRTPGDQKVSGQHRQGVVPVGVHRRRAPPGVRLVDDVIVIEAPHMDQLDGRGRLHRPAVLRRPQAGGQERQKGTKALAARPEQVLGDVGRVLVLGGAELQQTALHLLEAGPDVWNIDQVSQVIHGKKGRKKGSYPTYTPKGRQQWCSVVAID